MAAADADIEAKARQRAAALHLEGRAVAEAISACHAPLQRCVVLVLLVVVVQQPRSFWGAYLRAVAIVLPM